MKNKGDSAKKAGFFTGVIFGITTGILAFVAAAAMVAAITSKVEATHVILGGLTGGVYFVLTGMMLGQQSREKNQSVDEVIAESKELITSSEPSAQMITLIGTLVMVLLFGLVALAIGYLLGVAALTAFLGGGLGVVFDRLRGYWLLGY